MAQLNCNENSVVAVYALHTDADLRIGKRVTLGFEPVNKEVTLPFFVAE